MRAFLWWLFVAVVCSPLALVLLLVAAARLPQLDKFTSVMPSAFRSIAAEIAMRSVGFDKESSSKLARVLKLDSNNAEAWTRRCTAGVNGDASEGLASCRRAVALSPDELNWNGLGLAQEAVRDFCAAEDSFTAANSKVNARDAFVLRNMGRAALECGHPSAGVAGFELAEIKDGQQAAVAKAEGGDDEDEVEAKDTLREDREWLVIAYGQNGELKKASAMCGSAHPDWISCACSWDGNGVHCKDVGHARR